jgi:DNA-binding transcriptional LysR family regulator
MLDVGRLRFFSEVARAGSFTEAALRLSYSQSAVSQQIATLEAELGLTLIERGIRPLCLTDAGETLLRHAEVIFGEVATAESELRAIAKLESGIVRVGGFSSACATILPMAFAQFLREHPNVAVTLQELRPKAAYSALRAGELDVAVTYEYPPLEPAPATACSAYRSATTPWWSDCRPTIASHAGDRYASSTCEPNAGSPPLAAVPPASIDATSKSNAHAQALSPTSATRSMTSPQPSA